MDLERKIASDFNKIIGVHFPENLFSSKGSSGPICDANLSDSFLDYKDTQYYYGGEKKFVHWTSVQNLLSIINNREIRLYNLHNSSDPKEFDFAAKSLNIPQNQIDYSKSFLFTLSICRANDLANKYLWEKYGKNYTGVAIEFEIINEPNLWENFMISKVYYELPKSLNDFFLDLKVFSEKYPGCKVNIDLGKLIAFHKKQSYHQENEIRLSTYFPYDSMEAYRTFCNTEFRFDKDRPRITSYFGLSLFVDNDSPYVKNRNPLYDRRLKVEDDYFIKKPQIKLNQIHFGKNCRIKNHEFIRFRDELIEIIRYKLGYKLNLELNLFK